MYSVQDVTTDLTNLERVLYTSSLHGSASMSASRAILMMDSRATETIRGLPFEKKALRRSKSEVQELSRENVDMLGNK